MKIRIIILLFFLNTLFVFAQNTENYYKYVNKAELAICDSNYIRAIYFYKKAFKQIANPFAKDYYNFLLCGYYEKDTNVISICINGLVKKGIKKDKFLKNYKFLNNEAINYFLDIYSENSNNLNYSYISYIDSLIYLDQSVRMKKYKSASEMRMNIIEVDSINILSLINHIEKYGFPSEEVIGIKNSNINKINTFDALIIHNTRNSNFIIKRILKNAVKSGLYNSQLYAMNNDLFFEKQNNGFRLDTFEKICNLDYYGTLAVKYINDSLFFDFNQINDKEINKLRKDIYLESMNDFYVKLNYQLNNKNKYFFFVYPMVIRKLHDVDSDLMNKIRNYSKKFKKSF